MPGFGKMGARGGFGTLGALGGARLYGPTWIVNRANPPDIFYDFVNNRAWTRSGDSIATSSSLLTVTRAGAKTDLFPTSSSGFAYSTFGSGAAALTSLGLSAEEARTNVLLNSSVPATQTTASLGTGTYTLWVNGSGSATPSAGTATITGAAAATNGFPNVFTVTVAGTVIVTVSGSLQAFQLELGTFGTSFIITAGATVTRPADIVKQTAAVTLGSALTLYTKMIPQALNTYAATQPAVSVDDGTLTNRNQLFRPAASGGLQAFMSNGGGSNVAGTHSVTQNASHKIAGVFGAALGSSVDGQAVESLSTGLGSPVGTQLAFGKRADNGSFLNGVIQEAGIWFSQRVPDAQLVSMST